MRYAFEFRHPSWLVKEVYDALGERNISLCVAESERLEVPEVITADFVYYRLRKPDYTEADIDAFAARSKELLATGRDLYLMFKHEETPEGRVECARCCCKRAAAGRLTQTHDARLESRASALRQRLARLALAGALLGRLPVGDASSSSCAAAAVAACAGLRFSARLFFSASMMSMTGAMCSRRRRHHLLAFDLVLDHLAAGCRGTRS